MRSSHGSGAFREPTLPTDFPARGNSLGQGSAGNSLDGNLHSASASGSDAIGDFSFEDSWSQMMGLMGQARMSIDRIKDIRDLNGDLRSVKNAAATGVDLPNYTEQDKKAKLVLDYLGSMDPGLISSFQKLLSNSTGSLDLSSQPVGVDMPDSHDQRHAPLDPMRFHSEPVLSAGMRGLLSNVAEPPGLMDQTGARDGSTREAAFRRSQQDTEEAMDNGGLSQFFTGRVNAQVISSEDVHEAPEMMYPSMFASAPLTYTHVEGQSPDGRVRADLDMFAPAACQEDLLVDSQLRSRSYSANDAALQSSVFRMSSSGSKASYSEANPSSTMQAADADGDMDGAWPSLGSAHHFAKMCKPCLFWYNGACLKGQRCHFCHIPHDNEEVRRVRPSKATRNLLRQQRDKAAQS